MQDSPKKYQPIFIKPNSKKGPRVVMDGEVLTIYVRQPAIDGLANKSAIELLAKHFGVAKSQIKIVSGDKSRHKLIRVKPAVD